MIFDKYIYQIDGNVTVCYKEIDQMGSNEDFLIN